MMLRDAVGYSGVWGSEYSSPYVRLNLYVYKCLWLYGFYINAGVFCWRHKSRSLRCATGIVVTVALLFYRFFFCVSITPVHNTRPAHTTRQSSTIVLWHNSNKRKPSAAVSIRTAESYTRTHCVCVSALVLCRAFCNPIFLPNAVVVEFYLCHTNTHTHGTTTECVYLL